MNLTTELRRRAGIAHVSELRRAGIAPRTLAQEVAAGRLKRPRRSWIALPDADTELVSAARDGVILSCITQARRLGLWVLDDGRTHAAAPSPHAKPRGGGVVHWGAPIVPRQPHALEDPLENVLAQVARCQPRERALAVWESALNKRLTDLPALTRLPFGPAARELLDIATPFSDSGLESIVRERLRWLQVPLHQQAWVHGRRVDLLVGRRLILQIDGAHHTGPQRDRDIRHDAELALRGYTVIRVSYRQVMHEWESTEKRVLDAIARGLHLA